MYLPTVDNKHHLLILRDYCGPYFRDINLILRRDIKSKESFDIIYAQTYGNHSTSISTYNHICEVLMELDRIFDRIKGIDMAIMVFRKFRYADLASELVKGKEITHKGYISTSMSEDALKYVIHSDSNTYDSVARIFLPPYTKAIYVGDALGRKEEELLVDRGMLLKLIDLSRDYYTFEALPRTAAKA